MVTRRTKIVATLGPATDDPRILREIIESGVNVARFNFSHGSHEEISKRLADLRAMCSELGVNVATLADTKGPEIRLGLFEGGSAELVSGREFIITSEECEGNSKRAHISYPNLPKEVSPGVKILLDDGLIDLVVKSATETEIVTEVVHGGNISNRKSVNVPSVRLKMPFISSADRSDLRYIASMGFDFIAASFTRSADDVKELRDALAHLNCTKILIIAKIENAEGVANLDSIIETADGLMVARGDLGVEMPFEDIPILQKKMIEMAHLRGKNVITATQMLESMIHNPRPTRAEVSDVANAVFDGTSAIMLSGETANGKYPVEAIRTMAGVAGHTERAIDYKERFTAREYKKNLTVVNAISHATVTTAHDLGVSAILTVTLSGETARNIAKYQPACPIIACATDPTIVRQLCLSWGIQPLLIDEQHETGALFEQATETARREAGLIQGDLVVIVAGVPLATVGMTNMIKVHEIGEDTKIF